MNNAHKNPWKTLSTEVVYQNPWWSVYRSKVVRPDGTNGEYNFIKKDDVVAVAAITENQEIYVIGQYRYATDQYSLELPGGGVGKNDPLDAAKTELLEETGLQAATWKQLGGPIQTANGILTESFYVFLATGLTQTGKNKQAEEGIDQMIKLPLQQALNMVRSGEINEGQAVTGIMLAAAELGSFHCLDINLHG